MNPTRAEKQAMKFKEGNPSKEAKSASASAWNETDPTEWKRMLDYGLIEVLAMVFFLSSGSSVVAPTM